MLIGHTVETEGCKEVSHLSAATGRHTIIILEPHLLWTVTAWRLEVVTGGLLVRISRSARDIGGESGYCLSPPLSPPVEA